MSDLQAGTARSRGAVPGWPRSTTAESSQPRPTRVAHVVRALSETHRVRAWPVVAGLPTETMRREVSDQRPKGRSLRVGPLVVSHWNSPLRLERGPRRGWRGGGPMDIEHVASSSHEPGRNDPSPGGQQKAGARVCPRHAPPKCAELSSRLGARELTGGGRFTGPPGRPVGESLSFVRRPTRPVRNFRSHSRGQGRARWASARLGLAPRARVLIRVAL